LVQYYHIQTTSLWVGLRETSLIRAFEALGSCRQLL
jgi:hypothetical protein